MLRLTSTDGFITAYVGFLFSLNLLFDPSQQHLLIPAAEFGQVVSVLALVRIDPASRPLNLDVELLERIDLARQTVSQRFETRLRHVIDSIYGYVEEIGVQRPVGGPLVSVGELSPEPESDFFRPDAGEYEPF